MDAKELRDGNYYLAPCDSFGGLEVIHFELDLSYKFSNLLSDLEPIPLTEEWLVKFGFEHVGYWYSKDWFMNGLNISIKHQSATIGDREENVIEYPKHVHSLQNLYFALTGEELTIQE